jgi:hypothetical protein
MFKWKSLQYARIFSVIGSLTIISKLDSDSLRLLYKLKPLKKLRLKFHLFHWKMKNPSPFSDFFLKFRNRSSLKKAIHCLRPQNSEKLRESQYI